SPLIALVTFVTFVALMQSSAPAGEFQVIEPRCEYRRNPMDIDSPNPRLSWKLTSDERGQRQSGYQIFVASSRAELDADRPNLWATKKVIDDDSTHIPYAGKPLIRRIDIHRIPPVLT